MYIYRSKNINESKFLLLHVQHLKGSNVAANMSVSLASPTPCLSFILEAMGRWYKLPFHTGEGKGYTFSSFFLCFNFRLSALNGI